MKITVKDEQPVRRFKDLEVGDVFRTFVQTVPSTGNDTFMKIDPQDFLGNVTNCVRLDDGFGCRVDPERQVVVYHLQMVPE